MRVGKASGLHILISTAVSRACRTRWRRHLISMPIQRLACAVQAAPGGKRGGRPNAVHVFAIRRSMIAQLAAGRDTTGIQPWCPAPKARRRVCCTIRDNDRWHGSRSRRANGRGRRHTPAPSVALAARTRRPRERGECRVRGVADIDVVRRARACPMSAVETEHTQRGASGLASDVVDESDCFRNGHR